jgi:tmRNA-binding protein
MAEANKRPVNGKVIAREPQGARSPNEILETFEADIVLKGTDGEVAARRSKISIEEAWAKVIRQRGVPRRGARARCNTFGNRR